jgi:hypothetical protein
MRKLGWVVLVLVLIAVVAGTVLYAQAAGGEGGRRGAGGPGMERQRMALALQGLGLNEKETEAAEKAMAAKLEARTALQDDLGKLRLVADNPSSTDQQINQAIDAYDKAMARYRTTVQAQDSALAKQLSPRSHAKALAAGLLDNGLGGGRVRTGGGRMGGGGGRGGGGGMRGGGQPGGGPE